MKKTGHSVTYLPVDSNGTVVLDNLQSQIKDATTLISVMYANNEVGSIQPINLIAEIASNYDIPVHTDASQAIGKIKCDVSALHTDMLTVAGHKLYAPKGIGALYIKTGTKIENRMFGGGQENGLRPGTENVAFIIGLGKACEIAKIGLEKDEKHLKKVTDMLFSGLKQKFQGNLVLNGEVENRLPNTLDISIKGVNGNQLMNALQDDVLFSTGSACHAEKTEFSEVLLAMQLSEDICSGAIRLSTGKQTTIDEIERAIKLIGDTVDNIKARYP